MISPRFLASVGLAALLAMTLGCGAPTKPAAGGAGATANSSNPDLNKSMTVEEIAALQAPQAPATKPEGSGADIAFIMGILSDNPLISDSAKRDMAGDRITFTGTVLEKSPDDAEAPFLVLDGGEHRGKKYKARCYFAAADGESLKKINPQDNVRMEGVTDASIKELLIEFKDCVLKPAEDSPDGAKAPGADAEKASGEKVPGSKP